MSPRPSFTTRKRLAGTRAGKHVVVHYLALACDYDGTLATEGRVPDHVVDALVRLRSSGRSLLLVTGREVDDLRRVFGRLDVFECVVAENGGVLLAPDTGERRALAEGPPEPLVHALKARRVQPLHVGEVVIATREPHDRDALEAIKELGLEREIIFNKGAVMVLPSGVNKAFGLGAALEELGLSRHNVVGIGDGENDHTFLERCSLGVAVANAVPALKERADCVTNSARGDGVVELIEQLLDDDLASIDRSTPRLALELGIGADGERVAIDPFRSTVLVIGPSGSGKSMLTTGILERLGEAEFQYCLIDPEGDYEELADAVTIGGPKLVPPDDGVLELLADPRTNVVVNLLGLRLEDRPGNFAHLLGHLQALRARVGRPHWIVVDEAHHMLPPEVGDGFDTIPGELRPMLMVTVHPELMAASALAVVDVVLSTAADVQASLDAFAERTGIEAPKVPEDDEGRPVVWWPGERAMRFAPHEPTVARRRHLRKYAEGDIAEKAFVFRGPEDKLSLRAQNLTTFAQMARGVDDETWRYHLERGDVERWFRDAIKDDDLVKAATAAAESSDDIGGSRDRVLQAIEDRYTLPA